MKRFWLFTGDDYYADGGVCDLAGDFNTLNEAIAAPKKSRMFPSQPAGWWHILDTELRIVFQGKIGSYSGNSFEHLVAFSIDTLELPQV